MKRFLFAVLLSFASTSALALDPTGVWRFNSEACSGGATPTPAFNPGTTIRYVIGGTSTSVNGTMAIFGIWNAGGSQCFFNDTGVWVLANGTDMTFISNGTSDSCNQSQYINGPFEFSLVSVNSTTMVISMPSSVCPSGQTYTRTFDKQTL